MPDLFKYFWKARPVGDFKSAGREVPANSNTPAASSGSANPQACFIGLPTELRCQSYECLFSGALHAEDRDYNRMIAAVNVKFVKISCEA